MATGSSFGWLAWLDLRSGHSCEEMKSGFYQVKFRITPRENNFMLRCLFGQKCVFCDSVEDTYTCQNK